MSVVLQRLQEVIGDPYQDDGINLTWKLSSKLADKDVDFFGPWVKQHLSLSMRYHVLRMQLNRAFTRKKNAAELFTEEEAKVLTNLLVNALSMAVLLTLIYSHLGVAHEVESLKNDQEIYRVLLEMRNIEFPQNPKVKNLTPIIFPQQEIGFLEDFFNFLKEEFYKATANFTQKVRAYSASVNWPRLYAIRIRRVLFTVIPLLKNDKSFAAFFNSIDPFLAPFLTYFAWIFYVPRLSVTLFLFAKHLIPGWWMTEEEKNLGFWLRLQAQFQRLWFELFNDSAWFFGGFINCFYLNGRFGLAAAGMYLSIAIFLLDVILASVRLCVELYRLQKLRNEYEEIATGLRGNTDTPPAELAEIEAYQKHLDECFYFERKRLFFNLMIATGLFIGMCFAIPAITNPVVPFIGALIVVVVTTLNYFGSEWIESKRPQSRVDNIVEEGKIRFSNSPYSLFKQPANDPTHTDLIQKKTRPSSVGSLNHKRRSSPEYEETPTESFGLL